MSATGDKIRLAVGAFYEVERLSSALREFLDIGLGPDDIWLLVDGEKLDRRAALEKAIGAVGDGFTNLLEDASPLAILPDTAPIFCTNGEVLRCLRERKTVTGTNCLDSLLGSNFGETLTNHVRNGAMIAMAKAGTPALQDQCVRVLLRHSRHTVHSQECGYKES